MIGSLFPYFSIANLQCCSVVRSQLLVVFSQHSSIFHWNTVQERNCNNAASSLSKWAITKYVLLIARSLKYMILELLGFNCKIWRVEDFVLFAIMLSRVWNSTLYWSADVSRSFRLSATMYGMLQSQISFMIKFGRRDVFLIYTMVKHSHGNNTANYFLLSLLSLLGLFKVDILSSFSGSCFYCRCLLE